MNDSDHISFTVELAGGELPDAIPFMPEGVHTVKASINDKPGTATVIVDETCLPALKRDLDAKLASNVRPVVYFDHTKGPAAFLPDGIIYKPGVGLLLTGEWTKRGGDAVLGKEYSYFSPNFVYSWKTKKPQGLRPVAEVGSLVNEPAFEGIARIAASKVQEPVESTDKSGSSGENGIEVNAGDESGKQPNHKIMYDLLIKKGIMTQAEAESENAASIAESRIAALVADKGKSAELATAKTELETQKTELGTISAAKAELEKTLESKTAELESALAHISAAKAEKESLVEAELIAAIQAGKIAPQDEAAKEALKSSLTANIAAGRALIASMQPNPALATIAAGKTAGGTENTATGLDRVAQAIEKDNA